MKVHLYKVEKGEHSAELVDILEMVYAQNNLKKRIRFLRSTEVRIEKITRDNGLWFMDFIKIRTDHGPGKASRDKAVSGFEFGENEGFAEESAALFDPSTGYFIVQYNHYGVRSGLMREYFEAYDESHTNTFELHPKLDEGVERRLRHQNFTKKISFAVDLSKMSNHDRKNGAPFSEAIVYGREVGADKIKVEVSVSRENTNGLIGKALGTINSLIGISSDNPEAVSKLEVTGKEDRFGSAEVLDLLGHRLTVSFDRLTPGEDLRLTLRDRWNALLRAKNGWSKIIK